MIWFDMAAVHEKQSHKVVKTLLEILRCERASEPKGLETNTRKREKGNRNLLGLVFPIKKRLVLARFELDVGLESEKYKNFIRKLYIFQSALKKLVIFREPA